MSLENDGKRLVAPPSTASSSGQTADGIADLADRVQARVQVVFKQLVATGMPANEAAARALSQVC